MPVLEKSDIKKEDLGALADLLVEEAPANRGSSPVQPFFVEVRYEGGKRTSSLCIEQEGWNNLIDAPRALVAQFADPKRYFVLFDSVSDNGTQRYLIYEKW